MKFWCAIALAMTFAATASAQELKIGYVDLQHALNESEAGKRAKEDFKKQVDKLQNDLKHQKDQLDTLKDQLEKKSLVMKEEERRNMEKDYQRKLRDFERAYKDSQGELQSKDNELTAQLLKELQGVISEYGRAENYSLILETSSGGVLYGSPQLDLTDKIIEAYNKKKKH
jgi:outer membrane protein